MGPHMDKNNNINCKFCCLWNRQLEFFKDLWSLGNCRGFFDVCFEEVCEVVCRKCGVFSQIEEVKKKYLLPVFQVEMLSVSIATSSSLCLYNIKSGLWPYLYLTDTRFCFLLLAFPFGKLSMNDFTFAKLERNRLSTSITALSKFRWISVSGLQQLLQSPNNWSSPTTLWHKVWLNISFDQIIQAITYQKSTATPTLQCHGIEAHRQAFFGRIGYTLHNNMAERCSH